jgi:hypothetical protein
MPARKPRPPDEKSQRERFIETAREIGASENPEEFERVFREVVKRGRRTEKRLPSNPPFDRTD